MLTYPLEYDEMADEVKEQFISECGPARSFIKTRCNLFKASCRIHDWNYTAGGSEKDRKRADFGFFKRCAQNATNLNNPWRIWYYMLIATLWYLAIRLFGWHYFNYGPYRNVQEILEINHEKRKK